MRLLLAVPYLRHLFLGDGGVLGGGCLSDPTSLCARLLFDLGLLGNAEPHLSLSIQLGGIALGTSQTTAQASSLGPYPTDIVSVQDHLQALVERYADAGNKVREAIDACDEAGDAGTADLLTAYSHMLDKSLRFIQSNIG